MANVGIILLIILSIFLIFAMIGLIIWGLSSNASANSSSNNGGGTAVLPPCSTAVNISSLIQIPPGTDTNCTQGGVTGTLYYLGDLDENFDYVAAPWGTQPLDVCIGFCTGYTGGICTGAVSSGKSAQDNFNNCMNQLSSTTCATPLPIAVRGTTLYYAYSPTCLSCDSCNK